MLMYQLIRALGLIAYLSFSLTVGLGIASAGGGRTIRALDRRLVRQLLHRSTAVIGLATLALHVGLTVADTYVDTSLAAVLVPFTAGYDTFALGLGSLAIYALVLAGISGWLRTTLARRVSERTWRWLHWGSYAGWALALLHGLIAGPDTAAVWALVTYAAGIALVLAGAIGRLVTARHQVRRRDGDLVAPRAAVLVGSEER